MWIPSSGLDFGSDFSTQSSPWGGVGKAFEWTRSILEWQGAGTSLLMKGVGANTESVDNMLERSIGSLALVLLPLQELAESLQEVYGNGAPPGATAVGAVVNGGLIAGAGIAGGIYAGPPGAAIAGSAMEEMLPSNAETGEYTFEAMSYSMNAWQFSAVNFGPGAP